MKRFNSLLAGMFLFVLIVALTACGYLEAPLFNQNDSTSVDSTKPVITLVTNPWPASELNALVAKRLIEQQLGNPVVIEQHDENVQWIVLARGDADASLEIWPSGHEQNMSQYIDSQGAVEHGGPLGPSGRIGWYIPSYMVDKHPELATWEGFKNPDLAQLFATAETGNKGRFLAGDPSWTQYDADIIRNLGLPLEVVTAGSEEALLAEVSTAMDREEPVLFYFYEPHAAFDRLDLTQVALPPYTEACYEDATLGGVDCAYPIDNLIKIFSPTLREKDPAVYQFLSAMNYSNQAQTSMLAAVESGQTLEEAAQNWIDGNEAIWQAWLP